MGLYICIIIVKCCFFESYVFLNQREGNIVYISVFILKVIYKFRKIQILFVFFFWNLESIQFYFYIYLIFVMQYENSLFKRSNRYLGIYFFGIFDIILVVLYIYLLYFYICRIDKKKKFTGSFVIFLVVYKYVVLLNLGL